MRYINYRIIDRALETKGNQIVFVDRYDIQGQRDTDYNWETIEIDLGSFEAAAIRAHVYARQLPGAIVYFHGEGVKAPANINIQEDN